MTIDPTHLEESWEAHERNMEAEYVVEARGCKGEPVLAVTYEGLLSAICVMDHLRGWMIPENERQQLEEAMEVLGHWAGEMGPYQTDIQTWHLNEHHGFLDGCDPAEGIEAIFFDDVPVMFGKPGGGDAHVQVIQEAIARTGHDRSRYTWGEYRGEYPAPDTDGANAKLLESGLLGSLVRE
jgi:hypothetical protein